MLQFFAKITKRSNYFLNCMWVHIFCCFLLVYNKKILIVNSVKKSPRLKLKIQCVLIFVCVLLQPIYDCINVAAINAATVLRSTIAEGNGNVCEDFYSPPTLRAEDDDTYDFPRSPTPITADDKVTRF